MVAVVLFTRDLRVHDNAALAEASRTSEFVVPLFVVDPGILGGIESPRRTAFLRGALETLRTSLRERDGDLVLRLGEPVKETMRVAAGVGAARVFVGEDASAYAQRRASRLEHACTSHRLDFRRVDTTTVVPPGELVPAGRDHYRVFTPYWRRWRDVEPGDPERAPRRVTLPPRVDPGELPAGPSGGGGEPEGRRRLERWLRTGLPRYDGDLAGESTSRLSPYLHFGCLSARELTVWARGREGADEFVRQLCWRDFYFQLLAANPRLAREDLHPGRREWVDDDEALARWSEGRTGIPIVDAAMRQLAAEGWISNRARLIVASYLTKTLGIDWRRGAEVFSRLLVDADVANNVGNWQWIAGTGVDTRPNRVLNPARQAKRFDPDGTYVERWAPEEGDGRV